MKKALTNSHPYYYDNNLNLKAIVGISLGVFLFLLFFQPLNPQNPDFNNKLLILAAFGGITLLLMGLMHIVIPSYFPRSFSIEKWTTNNEIIWDFLFVILNSVAFVFFARYVGRIPVTFHVVIIIVIISIVSIVILVVINEFNNLKRQLRGVKAEASINEDNPTEENVEIEFESENKSEYFHLFLNQIILIKSANNYVEVIYKKEEKVSKRLIRNTLRNTEELFSKYPNIIRCHRSCMVNKNQIQDITKENYGLKLTLFDYPKEIHVSRQYVLTVKEALKAH